MITDFTPRFSHFLILVLIGILFCAGAEFIAPRGSNTMWVLYIAGGCFFLFALWWFGELLSETHFRRIIDEQDAERANLQAISRMAEIFAPKLPADTLLQALDHAFPALNFSTIYITPEIIQQNSDGGIMQFEIPPMMLGETQLQILAREYFDNNSGLPIRHFTEHKPGDVYICTKATFERLLKTLEDSKVAEKDAISGETKLNEQGISWLRRHYVPASSPTPPLEFSSLRNAA